MVSVTYKGRPTWLLNEDLKSQKSLHRNAVDSETTDTSPHYYTPQYIQAP